MLSERKRRSRGGPQKRSPAAIVGTAHGADRKAERNGQKPQEQDTPSLHASQGEGPTFTVTSARETIGFIREHGKRFTAFNLDRGELGTFRTMRDASSAIPSGVAS